MGDACDDSSGIIFCGTIVLVSDGAPHPFDRRKTIARRATIEVEFIGRNVFCVTGLLNPNSFELKFCVAIFFGVCLSHGIVHRVVILFSSKISFWEV